MARRHAQEATATAMKRDSAAPQRRGGPRLGGGPQADEGAASRHLDDSDGHLGRLVDLLSRRESGRRWSGRTREVTITRSPPVLGRSFIRGRAFLAKNHPTAEKPPPCWQSAARETGSQDVRRSLLSLKSFFGILLKRCSTVRTRTCGNGAQGALFGRADVRSSSEQLRVQVRAAQGGTWELRERRRARAPRLPSGVHRLPRTRPRR